MEAFLKLWDKMAEFSDLYKRKKKNEGSKLGGKKWRTYMLLWAKYEMLLKKRELSSSNVLFLVTNIELPRWF